MTTYAPAHHQVLTKAQIDTFITTLDQAQHSGDAEHTVQRAVNTLIEQGLSTLYHTRVRAELTHNTDGYINPANSNIPYALLLESKRDLNFSSSKHDVATVLAQVCHYTVSFETSPRIVRK